MLSATGALLSSSLPHTLNTPCFCTSRVFSRYGAIRPLAIAKTQLFTKGISMNDRQIVVCSSRTSSTFPPERRIGTQLSGMHVAVMAASMAFLLSSQPVQAGLLTGSTGLESIPRPEVPQFDFLKRIQEENQKKAEAADAKFKSSPLLQELLKRSKANAARNKEEIQNKYCERGAEWGVGDCSTAGMSKDEREAFMEMLRQKRPPN
ncbi:hypothetical protein KI387_015536 [Taxus chinensis]|uniref:Uncharacterized protein n=1 Tax=Taxus chinensis TaxID=29808 RepID=A0AA38GFR8_TAXCH|nr:hypothetical protein KI387_015536 [Taxus chinensis]